MQRLDAHNPHQTLHPLAIHAERKRHPAAAEERPLHVQLVQSAHQLQILRRLRLRRVVVAGRRQPQQLALPPDAELGMIWLDPSAPDISRAGQFFF